MLVSVTGILVFNSLGVRPPTRAFTAELNLFFQYLVWFITSTVFICPIIHRCKFLCDKYCSVIHSFTFLYVSFIEIGYLFIVDFVCVEHCEFNVFIDLTLRIV